MTVHATPDDLATYTGQPAPADADRMLARASDVITAACLAVYSIDSTDTAAALRDATCAQVEQWLSIGETNDIDGLPSDTYSAAGGASMNRQPNRLAPRALRHLRMAGLTAPTGW